MQMGITRLVTAAKENVYRMCNRFTMYESVTRLPSTVSDKMLGKAMIAPAGEHEKPHIYYSQHSIILMY